MLSDDLGPRIALDPLGAGIPVGDMTVGIEHENRIVGHALYEQPERFFVFLEPVSGIGECLRAVIDALLQQCSRRPSLSDVS